jgi:hypothetical protein
MLLDPKKKDIEQLARKLFNPYAKELRFDNEDWKVFLSRLSELEQAVREEVVKGLIKWTQSQKKKTDKKFSTDERRYPHGYNQAIDDIVFYLKSQLK